MCNSDKRFAFFLLVLISVLTAMFGVGCGGNGNDPQSSSGFTLTRTPIQAQIQLPTGTPISDLTTLTPWSSGGATPLTSTGSSRITIFNNGPQYADIRDSQGRIILLAYLSDSQRILTSETTAEALVFFATGGAAQIDQGPETVLSGIKSLPGFSDVTNEVTRQLQAQGFVSLTSGTLKTEIDDIIATLGTPPPAGRGTIAEPTSASGLFLNTITDGQFTIQNNHLRRVRGWLRRIEYTDSNGQKVEAPTEFRKFDIAQPSRYGGFTGTVYGILTGNITWTPTVSEPYPIPLDPPTARDATYELLTFGAGASQGALLNGSEEIDEHTSVIFKTIILDTILPILANIILPLNGEAMEDLVKFAGSSPIMSDLINIARETVPEVYGLVSSGQYIDATKKMYETGFTSNTAVPAIIQLFITFGEQYGPNWFFENSGNTAEQVSEKLRLLGFVDVFLSATDMAIFLNDYNKSDSKNRFTLTTTRGKASLRADDQIISTADSTFVRATIQNKDVNAVYKYEWSVTSGYRLDTANGSTTTAPNGILASSQDFALLSSTTSNPGTAIITCKVTRIDGSTDIPVDSPTLQYMFLAKPQISPNPAVVDLNEQITLTMSYQGPESLLYKFSLNSTQFGTIDRTNIGNNPIVNFSAGNTSGEAVLTIESYVPINGQNVKFNSQTLTINVGNPSNITIFPSEGYYTTSGGTPPNDFYSAAAVLYFEVPEAPAGSRYTIRKGTVPIKSWLVGQIPQTGFVGTTNNVWNLFRIQRSLEPTRVALLDLKFGSQFVQTPTGQQSTVAFDSEAAAMNAAMIAMQSLKTEHSGTYSLEITPP